MFKTYHMFSIMMQDTSMSQTQKYVTTENPSQNVTALSQDDNHVQH